MIRPFVIGVGALALLAAPASANTFVPTRHGDPVPGACKVHDCSLREAVIAANNHSGPDTIVLKRGTYKFVQAVRGEDAAASGDLDVTGSLAVKKRSGDPRPTVDANHIDRIFDVRSGDKQLTLSGLILRNGNADVGHGGAVDVEFSGTGGIRIVDCSLVTNGGLNGGGVYSLNRVTISHSSLIGNGDFNSAGGVYSATPGKKLTITRSLLKGNLSGYVAGAYANGPVDVSHSTFRGNDATTTGNGGGLYASQPNAKVLITGTVFAGNKSGFVGGAYTNGPTTVGSSRFRGNDATTTGNGGGLYVSQPNAGVSIADTKFVGNKSGFVGGAYANGPTTVARSTFSGNDATATGNGGGLYASQPNAKVEISRSSFSENKSGFVGGAYANGPTTVARSTFSGNDATTTGNGGGLYASQPSAKVEISRSSFSKNKSGYVGGAYANGPTTVARSTFSGNDATTTGNGGGLYESQPSGTLTILKSTFRNNKSGTGGGAHAVGQTTIGGSTFAGNTGGSGGGGGVSLYGVTTEIERSTFSGNKAKAGAGISNNASDATIINSTVSGNSATGNGGGIFNSISATTRLNNVTVAANQANSDNSGGEQGGGLFTDPSTFAVKNSIVAGNTVGAGSSSPECAGTFTSGGHNLVKDTSSCGGFGGNGDITGTAAKLGPLADNGGPTLTRALLPGSLAIDHGAHATPGSGGTACARRDQRGVKRPQGSRCDIGAFERRH